MRTRNLKPSAIAARDINNRGREEAYRLFPTKVLQNLNHEAAVRCQNLLGHGARFGVWETPEWMHGGRVAFRFENRAHIDLRERLRKHINESLEASATLEDLLDEGVLWLTRYLLLLRLGPVSLMDGKSPLDCTSVITAIDALQYLVIRGIQRCSIQSGSPSGGLLRHLTPEDLAAFNKNKQRNAEVRRLWKLSDLGLWDDAPPRPSTNRITNPRGEPTEPEPERVRNPHPPIPDDYLAVMGPRVLWLVQDLGPNLINLFEVLPVLFKGVSSASARQSRITKYFEQNTWRDRDNQVITSPPFYLQTCAGRGRAKGGNMYEWPPRTWEQVQGLAGTLQAAHIWIALLAMAGRLSEIETLERDCVQWKPDGKPYADGKTYKLSRALAGTDRDWPAPEALVLAIGQQARLVETWEKIIRTYRNTKPPIVDSLAITGNHLWASLGSSSTADPEKQLSDINQALRRLARRIGLSDLAGGKGLHAHRFRKTLARLAGIAIVDSPRVLQKLLGHKDIEMTLHYICTDKALAADIERVARELRIMRSQELLDAVRASMHTHGASKYGGGGVPSIEKMIREREEELHREGNQWSAQTSYDLAVLLTANGHYVRMTKPGVICLKPALLAAVCTCDSTCENRIEQRIYDEALRHDMLSVIPILLQEGVRALKENNLLAAEDKLRQIDEDLGWLGDVASEYASHPDLERLREALA